MRGIFVTLLFLAPALMLANPALAGGGKKGGKAGNRIKAEWTVENDVLPPPLPELDQAQATRAVDIPVVVAPISIEGRLVNYAFVSIRLVLDGSADAWKMRAKAHIMRDAIVRASHEYGFGKDGERSMLDKERTIALVRDAVAPWVDESQLEHIEVISVDMLNG